MFILSQLSDDPVHFGEMLALDERENRLSLALWLWLSIIADGVVISLLRFALPTAGYASLFSQAWSGLFCQPGWAQKQLSLCSIQGNAVQTEMVFEGIRSSSFWKPDPSCVDAGGSLWLWASLDDGLCARHPGT